jgi:hypothetical protein
MNCELMLTYDTPALRQTGSRNLTGQKNASHDIGYLYEACEQISDFCPTIDGRDLVFGRKLHIGTPYRGKCFWTHQIPTSCLPT